MRHHFSHSGRAILGLLATALVACGGADAGPSAGGPGRGGGSRGPGGPGSQWGGGDAPAAAVPVETARVVRRDISAFIETNGTLEAENEVDLVARVAAPIHELLTEEGERVRRGQVLARLDDREIRAQLAGLQVSLEEAQRAYERAQALGLQRLISPEDLDAARSRLDGDRAQVESTRIQLEYTEVRAPFAGLVVARYVNLAQQVSVNTPLFRLSDFDPLLCPIQVPEQELNRLQVGQAARIEVEAWPEESFEARVLRIRPVVDAATGTVRVTLEVDSRDKLRPGMFARVFLEAETQSDALVIPHTALSLESIGDTVYLAEEGVARRREVRLGVREGSHVEVLEGLAEGEEIVVIGQDGLSDGTPVQVLGALPPSAAPGDDPAASAADPERLERIRQRMRERGLSEEEIQQRLESDSRRAPAAAAGPGEGGTRPGGRPDPSQMSPEQKEQLRERMRQRGLSEEQINERLGPA